MVFFLSFETSARATYRFIPFMNPFLEKCKAAMLQMILFFFSPPSARLHQSEAACGTADRSGHVVKFRNPKGIVALSSSPTVRGANCLLSAHSSVPLSISAVHGEFDSGGKKTVLLKISGIQ